MVEYASKKFKHELDQMYYPSLYVFPVDQDGEVEREKLINDLDIYRYGAKEINFDYQGELHVAILVNND